MPSRSRKGTQGPAKYDPDQILYRWSRASRALAFLFLSAEAYCAFMIYMGGHQLFYLIIGFLALSFYGFVYNITVIVDGHGLIVTYGIGILNTEIDTSAIDKTQIDKNTGVTPVIYNPFGENSLLIHLRGGDIFRVPCDDVKKLQHSLSRRY